MHGRRASDRGSGGGDVAVGVLRVPVSRDGGLLAMVQLRLRCLLLTVVRLRLVLSLGPVVLLLTVVRLRLRGLSPDGAVVGPGVDHPHLPQGWHHGWNTGQDGWGGGGGWSNRETPLNTQNTEAVKQKEQ